MLERKTKDKLLAICKIDPWAPTDSAALAEAILELSDATYLAIQELRDEITKIANEVETVIGGQEYE